jgi:hypothetical protein
MLPPIYFPHFVFNISIAPLQGQKYRESLDNYVSGNITFNTNRIVNCLAETCDKKFQKTAAT